MSFSSLRQGETSYINKLPPTLKVAIFNFWKLAVGDGIALDFSQWGFREFQLGDELANYKFSGEDDDNVFYLVCQGRVRILGFDASVGRLVSTQLIVNQTFGADHLFCKDVLPYQAIAATNGVVATIRVSELKSWLDSIPTLHDYLRDSSCERQKLIFFKTCTELRSLNTMTVRQILPYLVETTVKAGCLVDSAQGRFWLKNGNIQCSEATPPLVGESWGYPSFTLPPYLAETNVSLYYLSIEYWDLAYAIAPQVFDKWKQPQTDSKDESELGSNLTKAEEIEQNPDTSPSENINRRLPRLWRRYPFIGQQSSSDCGVACLVMISRYWGKRFLISSLRYTAGVDRTGVSLRDLAKTAEKLGFHTLPVRASLDQIELHVNPWIAHWQGVHYVVVWSVKGDRLLISDPAIGRRSLSRQDFTDNWTGYALLLEPSPSFDAIKSDKISISFWHDQKIIRQIVLAFMVLHFFGLGIPLFAQVILDQVLHQKSYLLNLLIIGFLIFGVWRIALTSVRQYLLDYFSNRIDLTLTSGFIKHILGLPLQFFASREVEDIVGYVQENHNIPILMTRIASTSLDALFILAYLGLMFYYNLQLTLLVLVSILPIAIFTWAASPFLKRASRKIALQSVQQNVFMVEMITNITTIKSTATELPIRWHWEESFTNMLISRFRGQKLANQLQLVTSLISHFGNCIVLWYGASLVIGGQLSIGQFVAFNILCSNVIHPILALAQLWDFQEIQTSLERLSDAWNTNPEKTQTSFTELPPIRGEVHFENVTFRYQSSCERNTLQNISFKVKAGQTIGIVGKSGSGKSTLVNLLAGLYRPDSGRILIDGYDITSISYQSLRSQLGIVSQCLLFSGSILENITLFSSEFSQEQAIAAAINAEAHDFIQALPFGYKTPVNGGMTLSNGQKQRIAIARALIRNPRILILDEATSSLDIQSERQFHENLRNLDMTTFIITHRYECIRNADHILVLDRGIILEQGNHQELIATNGLYNHLTQGQLHL